MTVISSEDDNLHLADTQDLQNRDFLKYVKGLRPKPQNRPVLEGVGNSLSSAQENDLTRMAKALSSISTKTRFSNHGDHTKLDLCAAAALLHDPALTGMAFLTVNLIEGEALSSVMSAIRKRITRSNGGQGARYVGVFVNFAKVKRGRVVTFTKQPHIHLIVLDCPKGSDTYKALSDYCRRRGRTKAPRSGNVQVIDHDLWNVAGYLHKNLAESEAAGLQHQDEVIISDPIREAADAIGQGRININEMMKHGGAADLVANPQIESIASPVLATFEIDAPVLVRIVEKLTEAGVERLDAVRRVVEGWATIRGFKPAPADGALQLPPGEEAL